MVVKAVVAVVVAVIAAAVVAVIAVIVVTVVVAVAAVFPEQRLLVRTAVRVMSAEFKFSVALRPRRPQGLLGTGSPGRPPPL